MSTISTAAKHEMARPELKRLRRAYNRHVAWQALVAAHKAGKVQQLDVRMMPSKNAKHRMYASADRVRSLLDLDVTRPSTLPEIGALIERASAVLS